MSDLVFAIPGDLAAPTGGYEYARRLLAELPKQALRVERLPLPGTFPHPSEADLTATAVAFATLAPGLPLLVDGLAYGALPPPVLAAAAGRPIIALVHHPLGLEEGLTKHEARALIAGERAALALATRVVVTSPYTARLLVDRFGVPAAQVHVAPPGTERPPPSPPTPHTGTTAILAVGAATPRKGYDVLVRALAMLADLPWRLTIVGALDRAPDHVGELRRLVRAHGLGESVALAGAVPAGALEVCYRDADILVSSSLFEGYGMVLAEGLARGLPIVMARGGAADETVPDDAALKVAPGDPAALAEALRRVVEDPALRARLAEASRIAGERLPRWSDTARIVAEAVAAARGRGRA